MEGVAYIPLFLRPVVREGENWWKVRTKTPRHDQKWQVAGGSWDEILSNQSSSL